MSLTGGLMHHMEPILTWNVTQEQNYRLGKEALLECQRKRELIQLVPRLVNWWGYMSHLLRYRGKSIS